MATDTQKNNPKERIITKSCYLELMHKSNQNTSPRIQFTRITKIITLQFDHTLELPIINQHLTQNKKKIQKKVLDFT